jgi:single-stranded DNA-binding protein
MSTTPQRSFVNFARLTVRLGTTPEKRTAASGQLWTRARVAVSMGKRADSGANDAGESYKPSLWLTAKAFTRQGDSSLPEALAALEKGALATLSGRLAYDEYTTATGEPRSELSLLIFKIEPMSAGETAHSDEGEFDPPAEAAPF